MQTKGQAVRKELICPIVPAHFELTYDRVVRISPDIFPKGISGLAGISIVIDSTAVIKQFEIIAIRINNKDSIIYNYAADKARPETDKLITRLRKVIKTVKVKKLNNAMTAPTETYMITVKFK